MSDPKPAAKPWRSSNLAAKAKEEMKIPNWLAGVVASVLVALVIGAGTQGIMLYTSAQVTNERLAVMGETVKEIKTAIAKIQEASADRWTRTEHERFSGNIQATLTSLRSSTTTNAAEIQGILRSLEDLRKKH